MFVFIFICHAFWQILWSSVLVLLYSDVLGSTAAAAFLQGWVEGICGVNVFNLVFLLFKEESLEILILDLHILYRSLYTSSGTEGRCFGRVVFTGHWEWKKGILKGPVFFVYSYNNIALIFTYLMFSTVGLIFIYLHYLLPREMYSTYEGLHCALTYMVKIVPLFTSTAYPL